jgi:lysophospholipid acyltransferase (LPLAT)-like uncharacterized protein
MEKIAGIILYFWLNVINKTLRVTYQIPENLRVFQQTNYIYTIWHKNTFSPIYLYRNQNIAMFVTDNLRGRILGYAAKKLGYDTIVLLKDRKRSVIKMFIKIRKGQNCIMAVDGPIGPYMKINEGSRHLSENTKTLAIAVNVEYGLAIPIFWRWDKFLIPLPFSNVTINCSQPLIDKDWEVLGDKLGK